jgi:hypothetical protein
MIRIRRALPRRAGPVPCRRKQMHSPLIFAPLALAALLAACEGTRQVDSSPPTVTYVYYDDRELDLVQNRADSYCAERYGRPAILAERRATSGGYEAVFACG